jgi:hypothetical protein
MNRETQRALAEFRAVDYLAERERQRWLLVVHGRAAAMAALVEAAGGLGSAAALVGISKSRVAQLVRQHRASAGVAVVLDPDGGGGVGGE